MAESKNDNKEESTAEKLVKTIKATTGAWWKSMVDTGEEKPAGLGRGAVEKARFLCLELAVETAKFEDPFVEMLRTGDMTRGSLVVAFTDSPEYVATTGTAQPDKPPLPYPAVGSGRRIIYANREARVWFIEETGELAKTHQVSGRRGVPTPDRYNVYSKSRYAWAPYDGITMEYMVRFAREEWPYGFHSIPINPDNSPLQTKEQLGTLRSGGCVRQDFDDAEFTFGWANVGTRVIMIP